MKANIRRMAMTAPIPPAQPAPGLTLGERLRVDEDRAAVFKDGAPLDLTQREYELLTFLAGHPGKVYSRTDLMEQVWNYDYVGDDVRTVDVTVRRLREKIEDDPAAPRIIRTVRGTGYRLGEG